MKININTKVTINVSESSNKSGVDVSKFDAIPDLSDSDKTIFDELVASLFKRETVKPEEHSWPEAGNPFQHGTLSGLSSGCLSQNDAMMEMPEYQAFLKFISSERKQVDGQHKPGKNSKTRLAFNVPESLLSDLPSSNCKSIMMYVLAATVITSLKDEDSIVTVEDWYAFIENVNSKL